MRKLPVALRSGKDAQRDYKAGTALEVLSAGTVQRKQARLYCVRAPDGEVGYAFLLAKELAGCPKPVPVLE